MLSIPLLKQDLMENIRLWLIVTGAMTLYTVLLIAGCGPGGEANVPVFFEILPDSLRMALGLERYEPSLNGVLGGYLYGTVFMIAPLLFSIPAACRLVAAKTESGMMTWILAAPCDRARIAFTQIYFLGFGLFLMFFVTGTAGMIWGLWKQPALFSAGSFFLMNLGAFCLHFCVGGAAFLASCACNDRETALMIGTGVPLLFYLIYMLSNMGGILDYLKYATVFSLCSAGDIVEGNLMFAWKYPVLILSGVFLSWMGMRTFEKRDLPL